MNLPMASIEISWIDVVSIVSDDGALVDAFSDVESALARAPSNGDSLLVGDAAIFYGVDGEWVPQASGAAS